MQRALSRLSVGGPGRIDRWMLGWGWLSVRRRDHADHGAAAVEFALVVPILLMLLFGMIDYGLYFSNQLGVQQGARDAARQAAVGSSLGSTSSCGMVWSTTPNTEGRKLGCLVLSRTDPAVGTTYVKIKVPAAGWAKGRILTVCEMVKTDGLTGFVPMPNKGIVSTKVEMSIEQEVSSPPNSGQQAPPTGASWSWC